MTAVRERPVAPEGRDGGLGRAWTRVTGAATRRPVITVVLIALAVRVTFAFAVLVFADGHVFQDDATYSVLAGEKASGHTQKWGEYEYFLYDVTATFLFPLTWLYKIFGPVVFLGQFLVASFAAVAAGATTRLAMEALPRRWAVAAGLVVALLPSQVLFSSIVLKDAAVWAVLALLALAVSVAGRSGGRQLTGAVLAIAVLYFLLAHLRVHTLVAAAWAAAIAAWLAPSPGRVQRGVAVLALTLLIPIHYGLGVGGSRLVTDASATLEARRLNNAAGAATAFVQPKPKPKPKAVSTASASPSSTPTTTAPRPAMPEEPDTGGTSLRALPRGLSVMLVEPYPVPSTLQNRRLTLALAENIVWWPLLLLALVGVVEVRRHRRVLVFPLLAGGAIVLLYALSEGNIGTAFRHRGEIVWAVAVLAAFGARRLHLIRERQQT